VPDAGLLVSGGVQLLAYDEFASLRTLPVAQLAHWTAWLVRQPTPISTRQHRSCIGMAIAYDSIRCENLRR
jgi:hypothetical protein